LCLFLLLLSPVLTLFPYTTLFRSSSVIDLYSCSLSPHTIVEHLGRGKPPLSVGEDLEALVCSHVAHTRHRANSTALTSTSDLQVGHTGSSRYRASLTGGGLDQTRSSNCTGV